MTVENDYTNRSFQNFLHDQQPNRYYHGRTLLVLISEWINNIDELPVHLYFGGR